MTERYIPPIAMVKPKTVNLIARVLVPGEPIVVDTIDVDRFYIYSGPAAPYPHKPTGIEYRNSIEDEWLRKMLELANKRII